VAGNGLGLEPQDREVLGAKRLGRRGRCLTRGHVSKVAP
jgi:hypothetical protein